MDKDIYIGLMSGTSIDAVDAILIDFKQTPLQILAMHSDPIPHKLKQSILRLCQPGTDNINDMGKIDIELGRLFAKCVQHLLDKSKLKLHDITGIGSHGQTIRHLPNSTHPFTLQIGDPNIIVAQTGITTVADFRRRDMALGGQAAPLTPAFHDYLFKGRKDNCWVLNIGGIANLTLLHTNNIQPIIGFDTGPGNTLLDAWCTKHLNKPYDESGQWAASGNVNEELLTNLLSDNYFKQSPPKSTGREYFNLAWLGKYLQQLTITLQPQDIQTTLTELTAQTIHHAINQHPVAAKHIWLCGGGTHNQHLIKRLQSLCPSYDIKSTDEIGIHPDWIEAAAFAWLARRTLNREPGNLPSVTGAREQAILGAIYPAK